MQEYRRHMATQANKRSNKKKANEKKTNKKANFFEVGEMKMRGK
jgi:hypothetical protein